MRASPAGQQGRRIIVVVVAQQLPQRFQLDERVACGLTAGRGRLRMDLRPSHSRSQHHAPADGPALGLLLPPPPLPLPYSNWRRMDVIASSERVAAAARGTHSAPADAAEPAVRAHRHASDPRAQPLRLPTWTGGGPTTRAASAPERSDLRASMQVSALLHNSNHHPCGTFVKAGDQLLAPSRAVPSHPASQCVDCEQLEQHSGPHAGRDHSPLDPACRRRHTPSSRRVPRLRRRSQRRRRQVYIMVITRDRTASLLCPLRCGPAHQGRFRRRSGITTSRRARLCSRHRSSTDS